jgi:hypothetical protein
LKKEWASGKRQLRDPDIEYLKKMETKRCTVDNLIVDGGTDRMLSLVGRAVGYQFNNPTDERAGIANTYDQIGIMNTNNALITGAGYLGSEALFPEVIALGSDNAARTTNMTTLNGLLTGTVKNLYTTKAGGHNRVWSTDSDYDDSYIAKFSQIYTSDDANSLTDAIREVGIFFPRIHVANMIAQSGILNFSDTDPTYPCPSRLWTPLNISVGYWIAPGPWTLFVQNIENIIYERTEGGSQSVDINDVTVATAAAADTIVLIAYTPRTDSNVATTGANWGCYYGAAMPVPPNVNNNFSYGTMAASAALPVEFIKNVNYSLTVIYMIYISRGG